MLLLTEMISYQCSSLSYEQGSREAYCKTSMILIQYSEFVLCLHFAIGYNCVKLDSLMSWYCKVSIAKHLWFGYNILNSYCAYTLQLATMVFSLIVSCHDIGKYVLQNIYDFDIIF